jgi:DNA invertase Pin-like site-specific DNA recombinase
MPYILGVAGRNRHPRAFGYLRVSTDAQADSGLGLEAQRTAVEAAATRLGVALVDVFTDAGLSGSLDMEDRPSLFAAVQALKRGDVLLVAKRDRIGRDLIGVAMIERSIIRKGARIVSAAGEGTEGTDAGAMMQRQILDVFAEYERRLIGQRTKAALRAKRERGERAGNVPFGYALGADGQKLELSAPEQTVLSILGELRSAGYSLRQIAAELNRQGFTTRRGTPWRHQYVAALAA